jgi:peptidyl-prolyl cis-trans isomerase D
LFSSVVLQQIPAYHDAIIPTTREACLLGRKRENRVTVMLTGMRGAANSWLGKIVLTVMFGFLIVSFAIWGIGDIFKGYGATTLAKVGGTEIGIEPFRRAYQQRIFEIQQRSRGFTGEQARQIGIDRQVLSQMTGEAALNESTRKLGLAISDEEMARSLAALPNFRGADGKFNRVLFDNTIREAGLNEAGFIQQQKQATLRQQLGDAITGGMAAPAALLEMIQRYQKEERTISYIIVPGAIASSLPAPDEAVLKAFHDQRKGAYRAPEFRKAQIMALSPTEFAADAAVTDQEIQAAYERALAAGQLGSPEKRKVQQILFADAAAASAASERIKGGMTFEALAEDLKLKPTDIDLGERARSEIADRAIAAAVFSAELNAVTPPVQGQFGTVLLRVTAITPGAAQPLETVKETLRTQIGAQKLANDRGIRRKIDDIHDKVEELRSAGKSLDQIAKETGRPLTVLDAIDAQGRDKAGTPVNGIPDAADTLKALFHSDRGVDNEAIRTRENGYVWFEVLAIETGRERSFEEVKDEVSEAWRRDEANRLSSEQAAAFLKRAEGGEALDAIATELGVNVEQAEGLTRNGTSAIGPSAAASAFALAVNGFAIAPTGNGSDRMIMKLLASNIPAFDANDSGAKTLQTQLNGTLADEILSQYVNQLQTTLGVSVNERVLSQATGATQPR